MGDYSMASFGIDMSDLKLWTILEATLKAAGTVTPGSVSVIDGLLADIAGQALNTLDLGRTAEIHIIPEGDHFDVPTAGHPTGAIDSILLAVNGNTKVISMAIDGLRAQDLAAITDPEAAMRRFLRQDDRFFLANGDDTIHTYEGDDEVRVGGGNNRVWAGKGDDTVSAIGATSGRNIFYGEAGDDRLDGWNGRDRLDGGDGKDWLLGWGGDDRLKGGAGNDRLQGKAGADLLFGGAGRDVFDFDTFDAGASRSTRDTIGDFARGEDRIELRQFRIDGAFGDKLAFIGSRAFTDAGQVRVVDAGADLQVQVNTEGSRAADFVIVVEDVAHLGKADFLL